jgi:PAS domain S-box-containing protein
MDSDHYFRALTERSPELVCVLDADGTLRYVNPAMSTFVGCAPSDAIGQSVFTFVETHDVDRLRQTLAELSQRANDTISGEFAFRHRDGSSRLTRCVAHNLLDDEAVRGIVLYAHDVSERLRVEDALRESEARFAHIAANVPGVVYQFVFRADGSMGYTFVSEGVRALFGVAPEDALRDRSTLISLIHPDDIGPFRELAYAAAVNGGPLRWEGRVVLASGEERYVQIVAHDERQPDGSVLSDGLITDVTELRRAVQQLDESEQRYRSLFDNNPDAVFSLDATGRYLSANPACESISGYSPSELVGMSFEPLMEPEDLETARANFAASLNGATTRSELAILNRDGRRVDLAIRTLPMIVGGKVVGVFGIAEDLTEQRNLQAMLRQAQKMEAIGRLAGGVAHDFNNLLTVILSYTQLAIADLEPGEIRTDLQQVRAAAHRAAELTRQLLAFSRRQMLKAERLDVNRVVSGGASMLRRLIGEDIALETELAPTVWPVIADPGQLEQVLVNLAVNARDAMSSGGTLRLRTANVSVAGPSADRPGLATGDYVTISVEDTGTGIQPTALSHLFEPFFTTKAVGEGPGLGLAMVYGIVKQSGGNVYADSTPGEGSCFTVYLPRAAEAAARDEATNAANPPGGTEVILLVEDEAAVREVLGRMLRSFGYTVVQAGSVAEAMEVAEETYASGRRFDLVLTDVVMPGESGRALAERLAERWPELRVLYMSGYTDDEILRRGLLQSDTRFLQKPFTSDRLAEVVRSTLDERR